MRPRLEARDRRVDVCKLPTGHPMADRTQSDEPARKLIVKLYQSRKQQITLRRRNGEWSPIICFWQLAAKARSDRPISVCIVVNGSRVRHAMRSNARRAIAS